MRRAAIAGGAVPGGILIAATALVLAAVRFEATPLLRGPAPYPPEWQWGAAAKPWTARAVPAVVCAAGLLLLIGLSGRAAGVSRPLAAGRVLLAGATVLGLGFQVALRHMDEEGAVAGLVRRTTSGSFTSYHRVAASPAARDPRWFLAHHHELLAGFRRGALHAATHPPGPVLFYRGLIGLCRRLPRLTARLTALVSGSGLDARSPASPAPAADMLAAALLGPMLIGLAGAAACWPTAALARSITGDPAGAARVGVLWTLVPGVALMAPELDQALALPVTASVAALAAALRSTETPGIGWAVRALAAGLLAGIAVSFSYGAAPFVLLGMLAVLACGGPGAGRRAAASLGLVVAGATTVAVLAMLAGHRPLASALTALAIHREQFTARRSYLAWLVFNPLDLVWFLGPPVVLLGVYRGLRAGFRLAPGRGTALDRFQAAAAGGLAALVVSGLLRGEAGRILIPVMPLLLVAAAVEPAIPRARGSTPAGAGPSVGSSVLLGALLAATCLVIRLTWEVP